MGTCETLIRQVAVVDGTGAPSFAADVAITDGRIARIGALPDWNAAHVIDGGGRSLCPGWV